MENLGQALNYFKDYQSLFLVIVIVASLAVGLWIGYRVTKILKLEKNIKTTMVQLLTTIGISLLAIYFIATKTWNNLNEEVLKENYNKVMILKNVIHYKKQSKIYAYYPKLNQEERDTLNVLFWNITYDGKIKKYEFRMFMKLHKNFQEKYINKKKRV